MRNVLDEAKEIQREYRIEQRKRSIDEMKCSENSRITTFKMPNSDVKKIRELVKAGFFFGISEFVRFSIFIDLFSTKPHYTRPVELNSKMSIVKVKFPSALYQMMQNMRYGEPSEYMRRCTCDLLYLCKEGIIDVRRE